MLEAMQSRYWLAVRTKEFCHGGLDPQSMPLVANVHSGAGLALALQTDSLPFVREKNMVALFKDLVAQPHCRSASTVLVAGVLDSTQHQG
jgi:hypothetical protein